ncbi:hypothetical protein BFS16_06985 [Hoylesella timonensis]|uniref:FeoB-associated Cys-rich membrane protein n=1 Tax=Hoylesella timonensis TaxID=386414 RepID=A0A2K0XJB6_9BACT|nr:FeoB-associated Cys-rich membrane protein [Hoylesella timonensis]PNP94629.1 hypothetical protein BFS16_06985 [Hoylesella timonensis]
MDVLQYIVIFIIILLALGYACHRIYLALRNSKDRCYGCKGCELHDQILKKQATKHEKPQCFQKK